MLDIEGDQAQDGGMFNTIGLITKSAAIGTAGLVLTGAALVVASPADAAQSPQVTAFWQNLHDLQHDTALCDDVSESTHSTPETEQPVVYDGNCLQAFVLALYDPTLAFEYNVTPTATVGTVTTGTATTTIPTPSAPVTMMYEDCWVSNPAVNGGAPFTDAGPAANGSCAAYLSEWGPPWILTPTPVTVTVGGPS